jgi:hypothetical protein
MHTFNGTGTRFYGKSAKSADGSYVATRWVTLFFVPLIPIGSYRVLETGGTRGRRGTVTTTRTTFVSVRVPLARLQVALTYALAAVLTPAAVVALGWVQTH